VNTSDEIEGEEAGEGPVVELLIEKFLVRASQPCSMKSIFLMKELEVRHSFIQYYSTNFSLDFWHF